MERVGGCGCGGEATPAGVGLGDLVKTLTGLLGIRPCSACERRRRRLNRWRLRNPFRKHHPTGADFVRMCHDPKYARWAEAYWGIDRLMQPPSETS